MPPWMFPSGNVFPTQIFWKFMTPKKNPTRPPARGTVLEKKWVKSTLPETKSKSTWKPGWLEDDPASELGQKAFWQVRNIAASFRECSWLLVSSWKKILKSQWIRISSRRIRDEKWPKKIWNHLTTSLKRTASLPLKHDGVRCHIAFLLGEKV